MRFLSLRFVSVPANLAILLAIVFSTSLALCQQDVSLSLARLLPTRTMTLPDAGLLMKKQVNEVNLVLRVTDKKGHFIDGLGLEDFAIFDNDRPQKDITFFQNQTNLPLDVVIVIDTSASVAARFDAERVSITEFLRQIIRHDDSALLLAFNTSIRAIAPIRYNWRQVSHQLKRIAPKGETALKDAVSAAAQQLLENGRPCRRVIVVVSDGEDNHSKTSFSDMVSSVLRAEAVVYAINSGDEQDTDDGKRGEELLQTLATSTGGNYFRASENGDINSAFSKIRKEMRSQYTIAYKPSEVSSSEFHALRVDVPNLKVRCRHGYYPLQ